MLLNKLKKKHKGLNKNNQFLLNKKPNINKGMNLDVIELWSYKDKKGLKELVLKEKNR